MGVERVDYSSDDDFQQALAEESKSWEAFRDIAAAEPLVPCYICDDAMPVISDCVEENICYYCSCMTSLEKLLRIHKKQQEKKNGSTDNVDK